MGRRSRKAKALGTPRPSAAERAAKPAKETGLAAAYSRGRAKDEEARAKLVPLAPGERPTAVTVGAIVAAALAVANLGAYLAGARVRGSGNNFGGVAFFALLMLIAAWGMWRAKYWAVLGFEALLGITIAVAALSLLVSSNIAAVILCVGIIVPSGYLFYKLVKAMARLQMPERRRPGDVG